MKINKSTYPIIILLLLASGLIWYGVLQSSFQSEFVWRSLLLNTVFFTTISLFGTLFFSMHKLANAIWINKIQPVMLTMGEVFVFLLLFYLILIIGLGNNYYWVLNGSENDWYLNLPFFIGRNIFILGGYALFCILISKKAMNKNVGNNKILPAVFLMFFGMTILFYGYDWIVSLNQYWYSTLFGWYLFSGLLVAGLSVTVILVMIFEKRLNLKADKKVYQNLARHLFAFSMIWAYLWYVQYLLVWFTNKPGEVQFYTGRFESYSFIFYLSFVLSFVVPFVLLIANFARKNKRMLLIAAISGIIGQWLDKGFYVFPVIEKGVSSLMLIAIGIFILISVLFFIVYNLRFKKKLNYR